MSRTTSRLIVSFVGDRDLEGLGLRDRKSSGSMQGDDQSPILRLLNHLSSIGACHPRDTRLLLLDDDRRGQDVRLRFCQKLAQVLPEIGLDGLPVERHPIELPEGPTDLNALYDGVWHAIPTGENRPNEVIFHLTSGTPAMQVTLLLAANCLSLDSVRLFETSRERGAIEIRPPYVLAAREIKRERAGTRSRLSRQAYRSLLPYTVIDDPPVEAAYAALHKAAIRPASLDAAPTVLITGPTGSGKWHAARQFAQWRGGVFVEWLDPSSMASPADATLSTVLVRRLDGWPAEALTRLSSWRIRFPTVALVATWRTDVAAAAPLATVAREGLQGAEHVLLPSLSTRSDIVALGEANATRMGIWTAKLKKRLQYELLTDVYPHNLHDLQTVLATTDSRSKSRHPERTAYVEARQLVDATEARALLLEAYETLAGLRFGKGRPGLDEVINVMRAAVVRCAQAERRTQHDVGELLGCSQQNVSSILSHKIELRHWRTRLTSSDPDVG